VLGCEPYHPHWATTGTQLFVQAGFVISQAGTILAQVGPVATEKVHRGKGLATALVQRCLSWMQAHGAGVALISTGLDNTPALRA
jgi:GNAT superfamily N-acetyltransferase